VSGGAFGNFYFAVEEAMIGHVNGISEMLAHVEQESHLYDPRTVDILKRLRDRVVQAQVELHEANEVLHDIEWVASRDYSKDTLTRTIEAYLKKYPLT